jgi:predicted acetyltransferase
MVLSLLYRSGIVQVELEKISEDGLDTLKNLIEFGAYDLSELTGANISEKGSYIYNINHRDWYENPACDLYFIRVDGKLAGFVIIKHIPEEDIYYLNHFFILVRVEYSSTSLLEKCNKGLYKRSIQGIQAKR